MPVVYLIGSGILFMQMEAHCNNWCITVVAQNIINLKKILSCAQSVILNIFVPKEQYISEGQIGKADEMLCKFCSVYSNIYSKAQ